MVVDHDPGLAGIRQLRALDQHRSVGVHDDEQRHVCHHAQSLLRLYYFIGLSIHGLVEDGIKRFVVLFDDDVGVLAEEAAYRAGSESRTECVHVRPSVSHDEHLVGILYESFHGVGYDSRLAAVVFLERLQRSAVIACTVVSLYYRLVASASERKLKCRFRQLGRLYQRNA